MISRLSIGVMILVCAIGLSAWGQDYPTTRVGGSKNKLGSRNSTVSKVASDFIDALQAGDNSRARALCDFEVITNKGYNYRVPADIQIVKAIEVARNRTLTRTSLTLTPPSNAVPWAYWSCEMAIKEDPGDAVVIVLRAFGSNWKVVGINLGRYN